MASYYTLNPAPKSEPEWRENLHILREFMKIGRISQKLGIGTATPTSPLHVVSSAANSAIAIFVATDGQTLAQIFEVTAGDVVLQLFDTAGNEDVRLSTAGQSWLNAFSFLLGTTTAPTGGGKYLVIASSAAPSSSPADQCALWVQDSAAGAANLYARNEQSELTRLTGRAGRLAATFTKNADVALATVTGLTRNVEAGKTYAFTAHLPFDADAVGGHKYAIAGTCTATDIYYQVTSISNPATALILGNRQTALGGAVGQAGATSGQTTIQGTITVNAAGSLLVQFAQQAAAGASSIRRGATWHIEEIT